MNINIYGPEKQGVGAFDGGKITERKPIGFPGEGSVAKRIGPLFYWAWFHANQEGLIPAHPHKGFEIITYVISGKAEHRDSMGTKSVVIAGGIQVMQTGSGIYHEERFIGPDMEGFQIWFEPNLRKAFQEKPVYQQFEHEKFPVDSENGITLKTVIGRESPVQLKSDIQMWVIQIEEGKSHAHQVKEGYALCILSFRGDGLVNDQAFKEKDFVVIEETAGQQSVKINNLDSQDLHIIVIQSPQIVDYPLYPNL
jgi:redox-sensitive bicupin YhaK (pirin superfamily)